MFLYLVLFYDFFDVVDVCLANYPVLLPIYPYLPTLIPPTLALLF